MDLVIASLFILLCILTLQSSITQSSSKYFPYIGSNTETSTMSARKTQSFRRSCNELSQSFMNDLDNEELKRFEAHLYQSSLVEINQRLTTSRRRNIKHVAAQTVPEINEKHYSWLLHIENKADALCVDLSNLLNTLLQAKVWDSRRRCFVHDPQSLEFIMSKINRDAMTKSIKTGLQLPSSVETSPSINFASSSNSSFNLVLQTIENKIKAVLKKATELRNSIPIVNAENVVETFHKNTQTDASDLKNASHRSVLKSDNQMCSKFQKKDNTRQASCSERAFQYTMQRSACHVPFSANKKASNILKKQASTLNSNWKDGNSNTAKTSSNFVAKKAPASTKALTDEDMRKTGAIPKKAPLHPVTVHKKTNRQGSENSKAKLTAQKPVWR